MEPVAGPREEPGRKPAEGSSRQSEGRRSQERVRKESGAFLGHCPGPRARALEEGREPLAGASEESGFYLKLGDWAPWSQASESSPHR